MKKSVILFSVFLMAQLIFANCSLAATVDGHAYKFDETDHSGITIVMDLLPPVPATGNIGLGLLLLGITCAIFRKRNRALPILAAICFIGSVNCIIYAGYLHTVTTNVSGEYNFTDIEPGEYSINASAPGYYPETIALFTVTAGSNTPPDITLQPIPVPTATPTVEPTATPTVEPTATPNCEVDRFEENDTIATRALMQASQQLSLMSCPSDDDFYGVYLETGDTLNLDVYFTNASGDIDIFLFDPSENEVASSESASDNESLTHTASTNGYYSVNVFLYDDDPTPGNSYYMDARVDPVGPYCSTGDFLDPNESIAAASSLYEPETVPSIYALSLCNTTDEVDFYELSLNAGETLEVAVLFSHDDGDIDLQLLDSSGSTLASSASVTDNEAISYTAGSSGETVYVQVILYNGLGSNTYDMNWLKYDIAPTATPTLTPVPTITPTPTIPPTATPACAIDRFEDNDSIATRALMQASQQLTLMSCPSDDDFYGVYMETGDTLNLDVYFTNASGDIDIFLFDPSENEVASSESASDNESLTHTASTNGYYSVNVLLYDDDPTPGNSYYMDARVDPVGPYCSTGDFLDPNDSIAAASTVYSPDTTPWIYALSLCETSDEDDYFEVSLDAGETLDVDVYFLHSDGDIDLYIRDSGSTAFATSNSASDNESVSYTAGSSPETVYVHVETYNGVGNNTYDMFWQVTP